MHTTSPSTEAQRTRNLSGGMTKSSFSTTPTSRTTSPVHCLHPECMALATDDSQPRCRKVQQAQYMRPRHVKLQCDQCNDYPDGFRSEHELRRHTNRVHKEIRKVWITVDASPDKTFLANCKSCTSGKRYNECYNAASHLRRMHFHPRKRGEGKNEKRGGAGSIRSEDPPMEVLKSLWLKEVEEVVGDSSSEAPKTDRSEDEDRMDVDDMSPDSGQPPSIDPLPNEIRS